MDLGTPDGKKAFWEMMKLQATPASTSAPNQSWRGLGDVIAAATSAVGIKPCGGCKERQEALNKLVPFENKETNGNQ
jgi:hypothetical protein